MVLKNEQKDIIDSHERKINELNKEFTKEKRALKLEFEHKEKELNEKN